MSDEDHKLTVETETVEAPGASLLPSAVNGGSNENGPESEQDTAAHIVTSKDITPVQFASSYAAAAHAAAAAAAAQAPPSSEASVNLIDHNPLSPHAIQSLKNKKSTLLINSEGKTGDAGPPEDEQSVLAVSADAGIGGGGGGGAIAAAAAASGGAAAPGAGVAASTATPAVSQGDQRAKAATAPPGQTYSQQQQPKPQEPKMAKMIQRPSLPLMNSREILLESEKDGAGPEGGKEPPRTSNPEPAAAPAQEDEQDSLHKPTKADFFAARLASAVGENEISDSEETFIYESAANSTKNAVAGGTAEALPASAVGATQPQAPLPQVPPSPHVTAAGLPLPLPQQQQQQLQQQQQMATPQQVPATQLPHGVAPKMSVPVLNNNAKLLNRLKSTRHTSLSALPANSSSTFATVPPAQSPITNLMPSHTPASAEDLSSLKSFARRPGTIDLQSVKSFSSEPRSPEKRLSLVSLAKGNPRKTAAASQAQQPAPAPAPAPPPPPPPPPPPSTLQALPLAGAAGSATHSLSRKPSISNSTLRHVSLPRAKADPPSFKRKLRTTASKIFDPSGARRYSGIPDDVNLEDYIEQQQPLEPYRLGHELADDQQSTIQEEDAEYRGDADEDDIRSMFFYNHHGNLESRPPISDYDEDDDAQELDNNNHNSNPLAYAVTENTPLKPRRQVSHARLGYSPHNFYTKKASWGRLRHCLYFSFVTSALLAVGFVLGFLIASNKELQDVNMVLIDNVLSSADELVFDVTVSALNPGFFSVDLQDIDLDIFAKSAHAEQDSNDHSTQTVLLGTAYSLETSLRFQGNLLRRNYDVAVSSVKLLDPGAKDDPAQQPPPLLLQLEDDVAKWKHIIKHDYDLIVRGSMKYSVLLGGRKSVPVQCQAEVKVSP